MEKNTHSEGVSKHTKKIIPDNGMNTSIDASIFNDGLNTYMAVSGIELDMGCFEMKMLKSNHISAILPFEFRQLDAKQMIFFDINGLETMTDIIPNMTAEAILKFIKTIGELVFELDDYMLAATDLVLESKYIYYDEKKSEYRFAYVKGYNQSLPKQLRRLLEDILQNVFHRDKEGLDIVYDLYNIVALDKVDMKEILNYVERYNISVKSGDDQKNPRNGIVAYTSRNQHDDTPVYDELDSHRIAKAIVNEGESEEYIKDHAGYINGHPGSKEKDRWKLMDEVFGKATEETEKSRRVTLDYCGLLKVGIIITGVIGMVLASVQFLGTGHTEYMRDLMFTVFLMAAEVGIYTGMKRKEQGMVVQTGNVNTVSSVVSDVAPRDIGTIVLNEAQSDIGTIVLNEAQSDIGTTILTGQRPQEMYLESLESDRSGHNSIRNCGRIITVGRSVSKCDHVIHDDGVSRRHAELIWRGDWIEVIDLGSTNGTKINGNELTPGEAVCIKVGDVVSFGDTRFLCRN